MEHVLFDQLMAAEAIDFKRRFSGVSRLYGEAAFMRFQAAHVVIIGLGGVGSWVAEALARSAIGQLTLIDLDNVSESNINRQIQALSGTIGQAKVAALFERIQQINPCCQVNIIEEFVTPDNLDKMIGCAHLDFVVDAMDHAQAKTALIAYCREKKISLVTVGSAGGKTDPSKIEVRDLSRTEQEPLLALVRKRLRSQYGFPRGIKNKFWVDAVFSMEPLRIPEINNNVPMNDQKKTSQSGLSGLNCAGFGSSVAVTATFGLFAAAYVLNKLAVLK